MSADNNSGDVPDYASLYAQQASACSPMGYHELQAFRGGCPPGQTCVATPKHFQDQCALGVVGADEMPLNLACATLDKLYGPSNGTPNLGNAFAGASPVVQEPSPAPTFPFLLNRDLA